MERATGKSHFVALRIHLDDSRTARLAHQMWWMLSDAGHHRGYDLAPTTAELRGWLDAVADLVLRLDRRSRS